MKELLIEAADSQQWLRLESRGTWSDLLTAMGADLSPVTC